MSTSLGKGNGLSDDSLTSEDVMMRGSDETRQQSELGTGKTDTLKVIISVSCD